MIKKGLIFSGVLLMSTVVFSQKKPLGHDDFDQWQKVSNLSVSNNGEWTVFSVDPQEGDGVLTFHNTKTNKKIDIPRGYNAGFTADSKWGVSLIKAPFAETRQAKIDKKSGLDLPQDSLAIINLKSGEVWKTPGVSSYRLGKEGGEWIAWLSTDTLYTPKNILDDKKAGKTLVVRRMTDGLEKTIPNTEDYRFSDNGTKLGVTLKKCKADSLSFDGSAVVLLPDTSLHILGRDMAFFGTPVFDHSGDKVAYTMSNDSTETGTRDCKLYLASLNSGNPEGQEIVLTINRNRRHTALPHSEDPEKQKELMAQWKAMNSSNYLLINQYSEPAFSYSGERLVIGVAPYVAPDDTTLVDFEKASIDIWRWDAPFTPPQELKMVERLRKKTFPVVIDLSNGSQTLITDNPLAEVKVPDRWDADWALLEDASENVISLQWDYQFPVSLKIKNVLTGEQKDVAEAYNEQSWLSPGGRYVVWFRDRKYYVYDINDGTVSTPADGIPYPLWKETQDIPLKEQEPYGIMGWGEKDDALLVYDRFDIWKLDPKGNSEPVCITSGEGRKTNRRFRYVKTDPDHRFFKKGETDAFTVFDFTDKYNGLAYSRYTGSPAAPVISFLEPYTLRQIKQGKDSETFSWIKANFSESPNVYYTADLTKKNSVRVTDSNPQMGDYSWGSAQLFKWYAYDGSPSEGILYLPENFDPEKRYPMIAYFYETASEDLYHHFDMEPSWSWINIPFYVSRGYVIFMPDIHYTAGVPGESAWNYVCSGVEEVCRQFPNIMKDKIGIDGQSWGGYQTAYLVTRTNMFACAGSGAPVANMTSAFGGIRWESGDSRQAQYEVGQSRIGRNLWEAPALYLANSPVFYADRVQTPLLIMHNDADGAVPWYQGIEMFMALRRLGKPVWMLQYNSEAHNIRERRNRKDITKRLQQFFDHYLKGDPMPEWMKNGIPAIRKGQEYGY